MANYKTHDRVTLYSAVLLAPLCYWAASQYTTGSGGDAAAMTPAQTTLLVLGAHLFSGLWLSNDLDIYSRIYRRWGPLRFLWYPYQKLVAHRSWLSHNPWVGPLLRLLYLYAMVELVLLGAHRLTRFLGTASAMVETGLAWTALAWSFLWTQPHVSVPIVVGLILGSAMHSLVDMT